MAPARSDWAATIDLLNAPYIPCTYSIVLYDAFGDGWNGCNLDVLVDGVVVLDALFPEITRCFGCNTCTKSCPQELDVMSYMSAGLRGDLPAMADASFDCIMCGLCVARCPAELVPPNVSLVARRLYGKYLSPPAAHLHQRGVEIQRGDRVELDELKALPLAELKKRYEARQIEA